MEKGTYSHVLEASKIRSTVVQVIEPEESENKESEDKEEQPEE